METLEINYKGIELNVECEYERGDSGDFLTPPSGDELDVYSIKVESTDIYDLLSGKQIQEIEEIVINKLNEE